jgi:hypothetical protein
MHVKNILKSKLSSFEYYFASTYISVSAARPDLSDMTKDDWNLIVKLKKLFSIS